MLRIEVVERLQTRAGMLNSQQDLERGGLDARNISASAEED